MKGTGHGREACSMKSIGKGYTERGGVVRTEVW